MSEKKRASWSSPLAFILATAASAIGLGNLWRFPYLAAQYGGGMFIAFYVALVVTLGFAMMMTEIALGRYSRQSGLTAIRAVRPKWGWIGLLFWLTPIFIFAVYAPITGWVFYYLKTYLVMLFSGASPMGAGAQEASAFFATFSQSTFEPITCAYLFVAICVGVSCFGLTRGVEKANLVMMPLLFVLLLFFAIYVLFLPGAFDGLAYYLVPNLASLNGADGSFSFARLTKMLLGALGQMFYSLSLMSGIMVTYGSYLTRHESIERSVHRIEICDTFVAIIAGMIIVPVVYLFAAKTGTPMQEAMNAGPGLMFITLPKVFATFGSMEAVVGALFFLLVIFAAVTSGIALLEAIVLPFVDAFHLTRRRALLLSCVIEGVLVFFSALSYGAFRDVKIFSLPILDFGNFLTGTILLPLGGLLASVFVGWIWKPHRLVAECRAHKAKFNMWRFYWFIIRYLAPLLMVALFISEICSALNIGGWSI